MMNNKHSTLCYFVIVIITITICRAQQCQLYDIRQAPATAQVCVPFLSPNVSTYTATCMRREERCMIIVVVIMLLLFCYCSYYCSYYYYCWSLTFDIYMYLYLFQAYKQFLMMQLIARYGCYKLHNKYYLRNVISAGYH
jgi:hypothetical protein